METICQIQVGLLHSSKQVLLPLEPQTPFSAAAISQEHEVALAKLQEDTFLSTGKPDTEDARETWRQDMISRSPTFQFWDTILHFELLGLLFIRAHREANFHLYVDSMKALVSWFFSMDHHNYARWIPVHIRDMENLPPTIKEEFEQHGH